MAKIKKIIENGGIQYPATITDAVKNPNNGKTVTEELSELASKVEPINGEDVGKYFSVYENRRISHSEKTWIQSGKCLLIKTEGLTNFAVRFVDNVVGAIAFLYNNEIFVGEKPSYCNGTDLVTINGGCDFVVEKIPDECSFVYLTHTVNVNTIIGSVMLNDSALIRNKADKKELNDVKNQVSDISEEVDNIGSKNASAASNIDFSISDERGRDIIRLSNGNIQTKNFNSALVNKTIDSGGDFSISDENGNCIVQFGNGHLRTKKFDSRFVNKKREYERRVFFQHEVNTTNFLKGNFEVVGINSYEQQSVFLDNCVLYLPETYSKDGMPTKLIIYCKHGASTIEKDGDDIVGNGNMGRIFRYMLHIGYAILAADGVPNGWASKLKLGERAVGNYVAVQSTLRAYNYVTENYNIDANGCYIFGYSQGGHYAQNVIDNTNIPIIAAAELSPVCSMRYHQWDLDTKGTIDGVYYTKLARLNIARMFDYPQVSTNEELLSLEFDESKVVGYDPWTRNVENSYNGFLLENSLWKLPNNESLDNIVMKKHIKCPIKIWCAENDNVVSTDVVKVFVKAIKNSGQVADITILESGGHTIPNSQSSIGVFSENSDNVELYPIAYDIALWFYNFGGYKLKF